MANPIIGERLDATSTSDNGNEHAAFPAGLRASRPAGFDKWHAGEIALQQIAGSADMLSRYASQILQAELPDSVGHFFQKLPYLIVGFMDGQNRPWATILSGRAGFVSSPVPSLLRIDRLAPAGDPFATQMKPGANVALLGIDLSSRRRNRVNGVIETVSSTGFTVNVQQAFGNCPQYIQKRACTLNGVAPDRVGTTVFDKLDNDEARALLTKADTIFVATFALGPSGEPSVDVSHRGGKPGFLRLESDRLTLPEFPGNRFFNTLGNILLTGRAGLLIPSFETGDLLMLTGEASVGLDEKSYLQAAQVPGAERIWVLHPERGIWLREALPLAFKFEGWSPQTLATGVWQQDSPENDPA